MSYVPLERLIDKSNGSMFKLVIMVSKRALELAEGAPKLMDAPPEIKVTTLAMQEIANNLVEFGKSRQKAE
ncbi:MAG: DNA-directed RNA polymerase subunit omega [Candidatus Omnitrophica bacterium]|nr:DNA-directed RNA polymerase subunit omega [Candidatus Omnitrophota bacterium]MDD5573710.1 DNA-directed RNA polymerase subunit omega [Candidatus Omnitrophota bacterium]